MGENLRRTEKFTIPRRCCWLVLYSSNHSIHLWQSIRTTTTRMGGKYCDRLPGFRSVINGLGGWSRNKFRNSIWIDRKSNWICGPLHSINSVSRDLLSSLFSPVLLCCPSHAHSCPAYLHISRGVLVSCESDMNMESLSWNIPLAFRLLVSSCFGPCHSLTVPLWTCYWLL